ncbi:MAG: hypothetical protein KA248_01540 [Kiritimatiellae bacterium]|nr:hypothetical protein [Kiritimatiellia bacterium]
MSQMQDVVSSGAEDGGRAPSRAWRWLVYVLLFGLGLGLRIQLAREAYPARSDVGHIVHQGVYWAKGVPGALSSIWPEIPVLLAGLAYRHGLDPAQTLQWFTVAAGSLIVALGMVLARRLFGRDEIAWLAGLWMAANPAMLNWAVSSQPEPVFGACLVGACAVGAPMLCGSGIRWGRLLAAFTLLALGVYFRPLEAMVAAAAFTGWVFLVHGRTWKPAAGKIAVGLLVYVALLVPHFALQESGGGGMKWINPRMSNVVLGPRAFDSKFLYSLDSGYEEAIQEFRRVGAARWLWTHRAEMGRRYVPNLLAVLRAYSEFAFPQAFRLGNAWFAALLLVAAWVGLRGAHWRAALFLLLILSAFPLGVSISYIYPKWLVAQLPFLLILLCAFVVLSPGLWSGPWRKLGWTGLLVLLAGMSARGEFRTHRDEAWIWDNQRAMARWLRQNLPTDAVVMANSLSLSLEFDLDHPERRIFLPYGTSERVDYWAGERGATYILLNNREHQHWPVHGIIRGEPPPANWTLVKEETFRRDHPVWGPQEDKYLIFRREPPAPVE